MKTSVNLPEPPLPFDWKAGGWPLLAGGIGVVGALIYHLYGMKDKKMTKFEKACVAFVVALSEKTEELEKRRADLAEQLAESDRKRIEMERKLAESERRLDDETARRAALADQLAESARKLDDETARADRAEARVRELETPQGATGPVASTRARRRA